MASPFTPEPGSISPTLVIPDAPPQELAASDVFGQVSAEMTAPSRIDPNARAKLDAQDPLAEFRRVPDSFEDAGGAKKIDLNARAKLGGFADPLSGFTRVADPLSEFNRVSDFDTRSVEELDKDRKGFDPVTYFAENPNVSENPADLKKLLDVYRKRREEGLTAGGVIEAAVKETPGLVGDILGGTKKLVERGIDVVIQPTANVVLGTLSGDLFDEQRREALFNETRKVVRKGVGEISAGSESATVGLVDLTRTGLRKLPKSELAFPGRFSPPGVTQRELTKPQTDQELLTELSEDASFRANAEDILTGQGEAAKNFGLDKETLAKEGITLDEEAIKQLSLVDPITMVATGGAFKLVGVGGKVLGTAGTLAGAQKIADKLAKVVKISAGKGIQAAGKVTTGTGTVLKGTGTGAATIAGISSAVSGGGIPQSLIVGAAVKAIGPTLREGGKKLTHFGKAIAGEVPVSAAAQKVIDYAIKPVVGTAGTVVKGAATGIVAGSPFAIAAETDEQAGALLGAGAALGAGAGVGAGAFRVVKNSAARRYFGENRPVLEDIASPGYGDAVLDTLHESQIQKLSTQDASEVKHFREILRPLGKKIYSVDRATFRQKVSEGIPDVTPEQLDIFENHSAWFDSADTVYLNSDATGLRHDAGHLFDSLLTPDKRTELRKAITDTFGQKSIDDFKASYQEKLGSKISDAAALDEYIAEQFNALFYNVPVTELNAPKSLLNKFIDVVAEGAEVLGIDIGKGVTTPALGAPVSVGIRKLFQNAAGEVTRRNVEGGAPPENVTPLPPTPPPAPPGAGPVAPPTNVVPLVPPPANVVPLTPAAPAAPTAPAGRSIRVTPEQVAAFKQQASPEVRAAAAARAAETGVDYARGEAKKVEGSPTSVVIERISDSMESGAPVVGIEHLGITSVSTPEAPLGRGGRRPEQAVGYAALEAAQLDVRQNAPPEIVAQHSKNFVPVRWTDQGGTPTLIAMSLDKVISNILRIAADPKAADLIPYSVENGKLTPDGWRQVVADAQAYSENQANGRMGGGGRIEVPEAGLSIPAENPAYTPTMLSTAEANFQNLVQGLAPPQTSRAQPGVMPGNVKGQILAEANRRPVELPANIPAKQAGKQAFVEFPPRVVQEVNPLRNEMARRGVNVRDLLEVTERIRAKDIVSATPKPEINYKAPVTDVIRGGFLPAPTEFRQKNLGGRTVEEFSDYVLKSSPDEWKAATDNMTGGLTGGAWNLGLGLKDAADVGVLKSYADKFSDSAKAAMKAGEFDSAMSQVTRGQFFREAYEAATGTGSAGAAFKRGAAGMESAKPPFPIEATTESTTAGGKGTTEAAKFQPKEKVKIEDRIPTKGFDEEKKFGLGSLFGDWFAPEGQLEMSPRSMVGTGFEDFSNVEFTKWALDNNRKLLSGGPVLHRFALTANSEMRYTPKLSQRNAFMAAAEMLDNPDSRNANRLDLNVDEPQFGDKEGLISHPIGMIHQLKNQLRWNNGFFETKKKPGLLSRAKKFFVGEEVPQNIPLTEEQLSEVNWSKVRDAVDASLTPPKGIAATFPENALSWMEDYFDSPNRPSLNSLKPREQELARIFLREAATQRTRQNVDAGQFLPAEQLDVGPALTEPELRIVPTPAAAGGTPPIEPPTGGPVIPPPVAAGRFQPKEEAPENDVDFFESEPPKKFSAEEASKLIAEGLKYSAPMTITKGRNLEGSGWLFRDGKAIEVESGQYHDDTVDGLNAAGKVDSRSPEAFQAETGAIRLGTTSSGRAIHDFGNADLGISLSRKPSGSQRDEIIELLKNISLEDDNPFFNKVAIDITKEDGTIYAARVFQYPAQRGALARFLTDPFSKEFEAEGGGKFQPAEQLQPDETPDLSVVPAAAGGTPPIEPPIGMVVPPPVAAGAFQPRTEAGRKLEERGYEIVASGEMGSRRVTILNPEKEAIAQISSVQRSPQKAEIVLVTKKKGAPSGLGDVLYREVGSQLRDDGVRSLGGQVIAPEPLAIRKKIFGGFDKLTINEDPATYKEALDMAERLGNSDELAMIEPVNKITAATRFLPEDQQDMGFIRQGDAAIKVRDIERERNRIISELGSVQDKDRDALVERLAQVSRDAESAWSQFTQSRAGFLPGKRDAQGRPLDKEGNIDYPKWQAEGIAARKKQRAASDKVPPIKEVGPKIEETEPTKSTGWILPDKTFVPLDTNFHEQYLADNADALNKKFGTKFSEKSSEEEFARLDALNNGFVRLRNYNGRLSVEANSARWPSVKSKVRATLQDREGQIDSLQISLLNEKGQQVDSTSVSRMHEMSVPEKMNAIEDAVGSVRPSGPRFQPREGLPGIGVLSKEEQGRAKAARRIATVREENPEAVTPQYARDEGGEVIITPDGSPKPLTLNYNFIDSPLAKEAAKGLKGVKREEAAAVALGDELVKVYREVEKNPDIKAGAKWYSTARTRLKKVFGDDAKFFAELLGATSARTPVEINYRFALDAYNQFKSGAYDKTIAKYREGKAAWEAQDLGKFPGGEDATRGQFLDWWVAKHDLGVTQSNGKKFGMNSRAVLRVLDGSWASEVQGPKTPNFSGNLTGETFEATIDVWAGRTLQRLANQGGKARWRILPENETGISDADFYLGQAAYRDAAKKLGIKPDALQAVLWFGEKEYWEKKGWTRGAGAAKSDFNVLLSETERAPGGGLRMKAPQMGLDFSAEVSDVRRKK